MSEKVIVTVEEGKVRGSRKKSAFSGTEYYSFFGVPYGQSTGGSSRFKDPVKVKPWKNILDASVENKRGCLQFSMQSNTVDGSEDCLYNNIHTTQIPQKGDPLKAVIVNIHPGGFYHGSPETWYFGSPNYVMQHDIVYVCISHRLYVLGYLNLLLDQCSGNQGLKDIILSLEWIKENIGAFGGDPENVTLLGSSSGSTLIHYLLLSPKAKGLFHKAVMMGGYVFNPASIVFEENISLILEIAQDLGYRGDSDDTEKLLSFLKKMRIEKLVNMRVDRKVNQYFGTPFPGSPFKPTTDHGENAVLPQSCRELIGSMTKVPILFGICEKEAAIGFCRALKNATKEHFITGLRHNSHGWARDITDKEAKLIKERIEAFYWKGKRIETAPLTLQIDVQTDAGYSDVYQTLIDPIIESLPSSVYVYKFTFEGNATTLGEKFLSLMDEPVEGTFHGADYCHWAPLKPRWDENRLLTPETINMIRTFTKLITTFAKTGDPNCEELEVRWDPSTNEIPCYLKIDKEIELVNGKLNGKRMEFWENLKKELKRE